MITYYLLKGDRIVPVADVLKWARGFENSDKRVGDTLYNNTRVSTVFLGLDHRFRLAGFEDGPNTWKPASIRSSPYGYA
jgi:hypothetical protein